MTEYGTLKIFVWLYLDAAQTKQIRKQIYVRREVTEREAGQIYADMKSANVVQLEAKWEANPVYL